MVQVQALSGDGLLPASIELYGSVDGSSFSLLATLTSDDDAGAEVCAVTCMLCSHELLQTVCNAVCIAVIVCICWCDCVSVHVHIICS